MFHAYSIDSKIVERKQILQKRRIIERLRTGEYNERLTGFTDVIGKNTSNGVISHGMLMK